MSMYDGSEELWANYKLRDLCITNTRLPNLPVDIPGMITAEDVFDNLQKLAALLTSLQRDVGPFRLLSAYRTPEVQAALATSGEPVPPAGKLSFHAIGLAADITPTDMSLEDYFGMMLAAGYQEKCAEIGYKPSQNSIHLAVKVPYKVGVVLALDSRTGKYGAISQAQVNELASPFLPEGSEIASVDESGDASFDSAEPGTVAEAGFGGLTGILIVISMLGTMFLMKKGRRA